MNYKSILLLFLSSFISSNIFADNKFPFPTSSENYITYSDTGFYCSYLKIYSQSNERYYFTLTRPDSKIFLFSGENVVYVSNEYYPLINFNFPFLTLKYNVIPYIHPLFAIKFLYILKKLKFLPRVSDAMRTVENQLKYKRRGWSNVESSPHLLGIAADLSYFTRYDREQILRYNVPLSVHFLEHGGNGNHHIHLQDEEVWNMIKEKNVNNISDSLNKKIARNYNMLKPYAGSYYQNNFIPDITFSFVSENLEVIKAKIYNPIGELKSEIICGVFEKGNHVIYINCGFLNDGFYKIEFFRNNIYAGYKPFAILNNTKLKNKLQ